MTSRPASPGGGGLDAAVRGSLRGGGSAPRAPMRASVAQRHVQRMRQSNATIAGGPQDEASDYAEYLRQSLARDDGPLAPPPLVKPAESTGTGPVLSFVRKTTKYWVQPCDMDELKRVVGDSLPAFQFNQDLDSDSQLCNSVYLDNADKELYKQRMNKTPGALAIRLRWYDVGEPDTVFVERKTHRESWCGEVSVKERFALHADDVVPFLRGEYRVEDVAAAMREQGKGQVEIDAMHELFEEVYEKVQSLGLEPAVRTQYYRAAWQSDSSAAVRISLDDALFMLSENPKRQAISTLDSGRWFRDPYATVDPDELTWFPHGVLEVKLALPDGQEPPMWVQELLDSGLVHEVNKFSKFLHGTATLMPNTVEHAPYWFDDASIAASVLASHVPVQQTRQAVPLDQDFGIEMTDSSRTHEFTVGSVRSKKRKGNKDKKRGSLVGSLLDVDTASESTSESARSSGGAGHPFQPGQGDGPQLMHARRMVSQGCLGKCAGSYSQYCCWGGHSAKKLHRKRPVKIEPKVVQIAI